MFAKKSQDTKDIKAEAKAEVKKAKQMAKYSIDYDMSMVIKYSYILFGIFLLQLFLLEVADLVHRLFFSEGNENQDTKYLTPEITHTVFGFIGGWIAAIVTFLAKRLADQKKAEQPELEPNNQEKELPKE